MKDICVYLLLCISAVWPYSADAGDCDAPANLQVWVAGNQVSFSWSGTSGADIHAILLWNKDIEQNSIGFTVVDPGLTTTSIPDGRYAWRVIALCNTGYSLSDHSDWVWGPDFEMSGYCPEPSQADAGQDQINIMGTSTTLSASPPVDGTGTWTIIEGAGGILDDLSSATSSFMGITGERYVLRWTVRNDCGSNSDDVVVSFTNPYLNPDLIYGSVTDIDGNNYATIRIGYQTWMAENLKVTRYNDGTSIPNETDDNTWSASTTGRWCYYDNDPAYNSIYGKLYNWYAVNTEKLCPAGWHIPVSAEWIQLENYLGGKAVAGGKMKATGLWTAPNVGATNESGFSGLPGGYRAPGGTFDNSIGRESRWWTNTITNWNPYMKYLYYSNNSTQEGLLSMSAGSYCRCVKDCPLPADVNAGTDQIIVGTNADLSATIPSDGTGRWSIVSGTGGSFSDESDAASTFTGLVETTYVLRWTVSNDCGNVSDDVAVSFCALPAANAGADQIFVFSTNTTLAATAPSVGVGSWSVLKGDGGSFSDRSSPTTNFSGYAGACYVLRWTVISLCDTIYDEVTVCFKPYLNANLSYDTIMDIDRNIYATIRIGSQIWMAENLRTTRYKNGDPVPHVDYNSTEHRNLFGKLYEIVSFYTEKLCPAGWHTSTEEEWQQLINYSGPNAPGNLKSVMFWNSPNLGATNNSGFSALPGGYYSTEVGSFFNIGTSGAWAVVDYDVLGSGYQLHYNQNYIQSTVFIGRAVLSCRCIKD